MGAIVLYPGKGKCKACGGAGWLINQSGKRKVCGKCRGTGKALPKKTKKGAKGKVCDKCSGTGEYAYITGKSAHTVEHWPTSTPTCKNRNPRYKENITTNKSSCPDCGGAGRL